MLRKLFDYQLSLTEPGKPLHGIRPLIEAADTFYYESAAVTEKGPHIRDAIDIKRWMLLVVIALLPCIFMAIWNTGVQSFVYSSGNYHLMNEFFSAGTSFATYSDFVMKEDRYLTILKLGSAAFFPVVIITYLVGGLVEGLFACVRKHDISEGFLVSGILYALILPPTIPYWMVALGVAVGITLSKEIFGGSGMNIVNPALACRAFLFFAFPGRMSGDVWVGTNPTIIRESLVKMNQDAKTSAIDGYTQATKLAQFNVSQDVKRIHVDAIASNNLGSDVQTYETIQREFTKWNELGHHNATLGQLTQEQMRSFVTSPMGEGGLGLSTGYYEDAYRFTSLNYGFGDNNDWGFFFGNKLGSMGETSIFACLLGAAYLIWTGVGSWRTMAGMAVGAYITALLFEWCSALLGPDHGAFLPAHFGFPAYKHFLIGSLAFGLVFMATDPVTSPVMNLGKWIFGIFCGVVTVVIRNINPAYPEAVMLAILMGNVFAPLIDSYAAKFYRRRRRGSVRAEA